MMSMKVARRKRVGGKRFMGNLHCRGIARTTNNFPRPTPPPTRLNAIPGPNRARVGKIGVGRAACGWLRKISPRYAFLLYRGRQASSSAGPGKETIMVKKVLTGVVAVATVVKAVVAVATLFSTGLNLLNH